MKNYTVVLESELVNVAPRFQKAIYQLESVDYHFDSVKAMRRAGYNPANCNYRFEDEDGEVIREVYNAKLDGYGRRYN